MSNSSFLDDTNAGSQWVKISWIAPMLFTVSVILGLFGFLIFMGTGSRSYFEHAPEQATLGFTMVLASIIAFVGAFVLVGVRSMLQQHLDILKNKLIS